MGETASVVSQHEEYDPTDLDAQDVAASKRRVAIRMQSEEEDADVAWLLKHPGGRRFLRRLLEHTGVFHSSFRHNAMLMAHAEGAKDVGYWLMDQLERCCPGGFVTLMQEKQNERADAST